MSASRVNVSAMVARQLCCGEHDAMLIYSMSVSVDGFIADREGAFGWSVPSEEQFRFQLEQVGDRCQRIRAGRAQEAVPGKGGPCACARLQTADPAGRRSPARRTRNHAQEQRP